MSVREFALVDHASRLVTHMADEMGLWPTSLLLLALPACAALVFYSRGLTMNDGPKLATWIGTLIAGAGLMLYRIWKVAGVVETEAVDAFLFHVVVSSAAIVLAGPLVCRLYLKWISGQTTERERMPGLPGLRAWLSPWNVMHCAAICFCIWNGFTITILLVVPMVFGPLLAYPLRQTARAAHRQWLANRIGHKIG